jgi:hypothetical protein
VSATRRDGAFRTRRGRCVVGDDEIRIEESIRGHLRTAWDAYNCRASVLTHVVASFLVVAVAGSAILLNRTDDPWAVAFNVVFVVYLLFAVAAVVYVRFVSDEGTERIRNDDVVTIRAVRGGGAASPPRFVVVHRVGTDTRRRVVLPTTPGGDDGETYEAARRAFREAGYEVREG